MNIEFECMYCGKIWQIVTYSRESIESQKCPKCKDSGLKARDLDKSKVDYYQGSPPFPEKKKDDTGWPWGMGSN